MSIIKDKPEDLPTGNSVDATTLQEEMDVAYISLSATNVKIENPPDLGDSITLVIHGKCTESGDKEAKDGEIRPKRVITVTSAHKPGKRPVEDPNQGSILTIVSDENGTTVATNPDATDDDTDGDGGDDE